MSTVIIIMILFIIFSSVTFGLGYAAISSSNKFVSSILGFLTLLSGVITLFIPFSAFTE